MKNSWMLFAFLPLIAAGCNDQKLSTYTPPPAVTILEPTGGSVFFEDQDVVFRALIDSEDDVANVKHEWMSGTLSLCPAAAVEEIDGSFYGTCIVAFDDGGDYAVQVTASDTFGRISAVVDVEIAYNNPPTVTFTAPADGESVRANQPVIIEALVDDSEDESSELAVTVESSIDGDLGAMSIPTTGGDYSESFDLSSGTHLLKITVTDTSGKTGQDSLTIAINNTPTAPVVSVTPDPAVSDEGLQANIDLPATDDDGDTLTYTYTWYKDGGEYAVGVPSVSPNVVKRDEYWEVHVMANDGTQDGAAGVAGLTIGNRAPEVESVSLSPSSPGELDDVTATPQNWYDAEGDPERFRYQWNHNGAVDSSETTAVFPADKTTRGDTIQVTLTPYDAYDDGLPVSSSEISIQNSPPTAPTVVISPGSPERDENLTCEIVSPSSDSDGDPIDYRYNWYKNGVVTSDTSNVITSDLTGDGETWECRVTPNDGIDDGDYGTDTVNITDNTAPDSPILDDLSPYRNDDYATLTGTCEASCALVFYLADDTGSWTETGTCTSGGAVSHTLYLTRGVTTDAYATCEDAAGNVSGDSNTVSTESCDPYDEYENSSGYGDTSSSPIDEWGTLDDGGTTTITIEANALDSSDEDWYVISTTDLDSYDSTYWDEDYLFEVVMTEGESVYSVEIFDAAISLTTPVCETGTTEMDWYFDDPSWGRGTSCSPTAAYPDYTDCPDFSTDWYIKVTRRDTAEDSCEPYELTITNGMW